VCVCARARVRSRERERQTERDLSLDQICYCCRAWVCDFICIHIFGGSIRVVVDWSICAIGGRVVH
jgi:hypothetical protein